MFVLNSDITIGKFRFSGANKVRISRSVHSIADTASVTLPARARVVRNGTAAANEIVTGTQFKDGDPVLIQLGYNGDLQQEFAGFVKRREMGQPLVVECEGYSWLLKRNKVNISQQSIPIKDYLAAAIAGIDATYPIAIHCTIDGTLNNVQEYGTGMDAVSNLQKYTDGCVTCFFIQPSVLWCGLLYTAIAHGNDTMKLGNVSYRPGFNVLKDGGLKQRILNDDPVQVRYSKKLSGGGEVAGTSDAFRQYARTHSKILNQIKSAGMLKQLADEKAFKLNYAGYEGTLQTFLVPDVRPGYLAYVQDTDYPERNGNYLVEGVDTQFGMHGARRIVELGPRSGFANE